MKSYKFQQTATKGVKIQMAYMSCLDGSARSEWHQIRIRVLCSMQSISQRDICTWTGLGLCFYCHRQRGGGPVQALLWRLLVF